jgi:hypothetical protein
MPLNRSAHRTSTERAVITFPDEEFHDVGLDFEAIAKCPKPG